ncbi:iron-containing alcohol dehydrogenase [Thalassolituus sp. LLYu03]|uniref:iron-containing alcohol dehydrogenase n=1 Tax=Thalassolituus sp. LLYu03 TaxID=3421656 RepID=UPI003D2867EC
MQNFTYYVPTRIEFGTGKEQQIGAMMAAQGVRKVLLCYGSERIMHDGLFATVSQSLAAEGIELVAFGGIISNPVISKVREGIAVAREHQVDAILAVGGGSVLDSVKAMAAGVTYGGDVWDLFTGKGQFDSALPVYAVMTLAATGSEMNASAVVSNEDTHEKLFIGSVALYPKISVINPALTRSVPRDYLVYSAADIIAHSIEAYFTASQHPNLQSRLVESVIKTVIETTELLLANPQDDDARGQFAWAATLALNGITFAGAAGFSYPNHAIEHSLSALFNVPHGAGLSVVMPAWMKWYHSRNPQQFARFADKIFGVQGAEAGIAALEAWFVKIGTPVRLSQLGIKESDFAAITANVRGNVTGFGIADIYTEAVIGEILHNAL